MNEKEIIEQIALNIIDEYKKSNSGLDLEEYLNEYMSCLRAYIGHEVNKLIEKEEETTKPVVFFLKVDYIVRSGLWEKVCKIKGMNEWALKEALINRDEKIGFTEVEYKLLVEQKFKT